MIQSMTNVQNTDYIQEIIIIVLGVRPPKAISTKRLRGNPMDSETEELWKQVNWRIMPHSHKDILYHDTCSLCVIEQALYGGKE